QVRCGYARRCEVAANGEMVRSVDPAGDGWSLCDGGRRRDDTHVREDPRILGFEHGSTSRVGAVARRLERRRGYDGPVFGKPCWQLTRSVKCCLTCGCNCKDATILSVYGRYLD